LKEIGAQASVESDVSYDDICYWLETLFAIATPSGTGPYVRAYSAPLTAIVSAARQMTLVKGNADGTWKLTSGIGTKIVLKGNNTGPWTVSIEMFGYDVTIGTLAALSDRSTTLALGSDTSIALDAWAGTIGATVLTGVQFDFELTIDTKRTPKRHMTLKPDSLNQPEWSTQLKLSLEYNATSHAYLTSLLTQTAQALYQKQVRIKATDGTNIVQLDFAGTADDVPIPTEQNGVMTIDLILDGEYCAALGNYLAASVSNSVAILA